MTVIQATKKVLYLLGLGLFFFVASGVTHVCLEWRKVGSAAGFGKMCLDTAPRALAVTIGAGVAYFLFLAVQAVRRNGGFRALYRRMTFWPRREPRPR
jgi:hypothetical protein